MLGKVDGSVLSTGEARCFFVVRGFGSAVWGTLQLVAYVFFLSTFGDATSYVSKADLYNRSVSFFVGSSCPGLHIRWSW
jgi:hypothetical protein